jgi:drug/metabolite transporter (DMT)-like permease
MIYILISILCSVTVGVLFKFARRYQIDIPQTISWNYLMAIFLCAFFFQINFKQIRIPSSPIYIYLGILLPLIFVLLARSIKEIGIAKTDIAQRLSLFIPVIASYYLFSEHFSAVKIIALLLGFAAIILILLKPARKSKSAGLLFPLAVFVGYGIVDVLFKKVALLPDIAYPTSLLIVFILAFVISAFYIGYLTLVIKRELRVVNFICGCILGLFNFANIYFYLKAHKALSSTPSLVFASMNLGVIVLGTLIGVFVFREKLSRLNKLGIVLALLAVITLTISQVYGF